MKGRQRERGEPLAELAQDIKRLVRKEASIDVKEGLPREVFKDAVNETDVEWTIFQGNPPGGQ